MIIYIIGKMGCGKTLTLTLLGYLAYLGGSTIYSNYKVNFPHVKIVNPEDVLKIREGTFLFDEGWTWLDSRTSSTKSNRILTAIFTRSRKVGFDVLHTSQMYMKVDNRLRKQTDWLVLTSFDRPTNSCLVDIYEYRGESGSTPMLSDRTIKTFRYDATAAYPLYSTHAGIYEDEFLEAEMPEKEKA